jgi:hypothetical protein
LIFAIVNEVNASEVHLPSKQTGGLSAFGTTSLTTALTIP